MDPEPALMSYEFRTSHPVLCWLPTKLAKWIGANLPEELLIPDKIEVRWTAAELNNILLNNVVWGPHKHLRTFGSTIWESNLFNKRPKTRCYPLNIVGHRFWDKTPQETHMSKRPTPTQSTCLYYCHDNEASKCVVYDIRVVYDTPYDVTHSLT